MKKKLRITYFIVFIFLLAAEIIIGAFINDIFIRPYAGDMLVIMLICAFLRIFLPEKPRLLPVYTTLFAIGIETLQYFDFVSLLGLENNKIISIALGRTFDVKDIICYIAGGVIFFAAEEIRRKHNDR